MLMPDSMRRWLDRTIVMILVSAPAAASSQVAATPLRWSAGSADMSAFEITRDTTIAHGGHTSIRVRSVDEPQSFVDVSVGLSPQPYLGRRIRFSVFLRSASLGGAGALLWARADDANHKFVGYANSQATPIRGTTDWTQVSISVDVAASTVKLYVGVWSFGIGSLWIDDARVESDGGIAPVDFSFENPAEFVPPPFTPRAVVATDPGRPLTATELANVTAFTRVLGYVRFFHPSATAVHVNWDAFAIRGVRAVESAPTPDSLAASLRSLFAPISSGIVFARTGTPLPTTIAKPADATHVVFWRHRGVGVPTGGVATPSAQTIYQSERLVLPLASVGQPLELASMMAGARAFVSAPRVPDPAKPLVVALEGGVTASIPIALYTAETIVPDSLRFPRARPVPDRFSADDRETRLADVALAWSLFEHFYPYFDVVKTDWEAARAAALRSAATDADADAFQATLERLVAALHDGHGNVYRPANALGAPDIQLGWAEGRVFVTQVGDAAAANGVRRGDELLSVGTRTVGDLMAEKSTRVSGATPQWVRARTLSALLAGEFASTVTLGLRGSNDVARSVQVVREPAQLRAPAVAKIADVAPGVMYVDIGRITDLDFSAALPRLEKARSIIFDMRGYPRAVNTADILSHLTDTVIHSAHFDIPIITMPDRKGVGYIDGAWTLRPTAPRLRARIVFLSAGGAISYAESTLGVVEAYKLADIVGEPSAGTNGNVNPFTLPGGYTVSWTGMLVQKRDGTPHHGVGILPTFPVSPTAAGLRAGRDEILERAVALVTQRPATP